MKKLLFLFIIALAGCNTDKPTAPFTIGKVIKTTEGATIDVKINTRLSKAQMIAIAERIKTDSSQYEALQVDFLLPGNNYNNTGGINVYAMANYPKPGAVTAKDTISDSDKNLLSFEFVGFTPEKAKQLFELNPADMADKKVVGKFIDDNTQTITIIYNDKQGDQMYVLELDTAGTVVSATQPLAVTHNGIKKIVVSKRGDYFTLKDSLLTMYSIDDPEKPFRAVKQDI